VVDFRYHALSLVAVFLALGIGIVLGVTVGDSLVSDADQNLRQSLRDDVTEAREQVRDEREVGDRREDAIGELVPEVAEGRLRGRRFALVALGEMPSEVEGSVEEAIEMGGGALARRVELTPGSRERGARRRGARLARRLLAFDAVVLYREPPPDDEPDEDRSVREAFEAGAMRPLGDEAIGVETLGTDPSQVGWYDDQLGVSVDNVDAPAGQLALVVVLEERQEGAFGYKDSAEGALPDLDLSD
jgi:hypothetical protein